MLFRFTVFFSIFALFSAPTVFSAMNGGNFELRADSLSVVEDPFSSGGNWALTDTMGEQAAVQGEGGGWKLEGGFQAMDTATVSLSLSTTTLAFGTLSANQVSSVSLVLTATAESSGYQVSLSEDGNLRSGDEAINDVVDGNPVEAGTEAYGFRTDGDAGQMNGVLDYAIDGSKVIAQSNDAVEDEETTVTFRVSVDSSQTKQGNYGQVLTFTMLGI